MLLRASAVETFKILAFVDVQTSVRPSFQPLRHSALDLACAQRDSGLPSDSEVLFWYLCTLGEAPAVTRLLLILGSLREITLPRRQWTHQLYFSGLLFKTVD